jgi:CSLREA domain-containing protein
MSISIKAKIISYTVTLGSVLMILNVINYPLVLQASDSNVTDGITVDSVLDSPDAAVGNGICDDGSGNCTLRAAIQEANSNQGADTINFNIPGTGVRTIQPLSELPSITETVSINGYSQPGATANSAIAPSPLNGTLLIEIDGSNAGPNTDGLTISETAGNVTIRGLVVNRFSFRGIGGNGGGVGTKILGSYIGTDPTGLIDRGNADQGIQIGPNAQLGGTNPSDRNIISGNDGGGASPNTGDNNWVVKGNYFGVGADGETVISNSPVGGNGAMSIDNSDGHLIGGTEVGATNVISGNRSFALFPDNVDNLTIQGNIIGPNWKGDPIPNSPQLGGIGLPPFAGSIESVLIGGTVQGAANIIAYNNGPGIAILNIKEGETTTFVSNNVAILGNSIFENSTSDSFELSKYGLGIDHAIINKDVNNIQNSTISAAGPTLNDTSDSDSGPNGLINFPVITSAIALDNKLNIIFDLDVAGSTNGAYRVEFFANNNADSSGYGEGQTFLGATTVSSGNIKAASLEIAQELNLAGKVLTATTTSVNNTTPSGFGSTSEFSQVKPIVFSTSSATAASGGSGVLAQTGIAILSGVLSFLIVFSVGLIYLDYSRHKNPLSQENPLIRYTFSHHIKVVTLPLFRYRLSIRLTKNNFTNKNGIRKF